MCEEMNLVFVLILVVDILLSFVFVYNYYWPIKIRESKVYNPYRSSKFHKRKWDNRLGVWNYINGKRIVYLGDLGDYEKFLNKTGSGVSADSWRGRLEG